MKMAHMELGKFEREKGRWCMGKACGRAAAERRPLARCRGLTEAELQVAEQFYEQMCGKINGQR